MIAKPSVVHQNILNKIPNAPSNILLNISKTKRLSLQILYKMKIAILKQNAEILTQSVIFV